MIYDFFILRLLFEFELYICVFFSFFQFNVHSECQSGVIYAPPNAPCLEFTFSLTPLKGGPLTFQDMQTYLTNFLTATNSKGELYNAIIAINPDTEIVGMGSPGGGIPLIVVADGNEDDEDSSTPSTPSQIVKLNSGGDGTNSVQGRYVYFYFIHSSIMTYAV